MIKFFLGLLTGAAVGLLLAPKTGTETRQIVAARVPEILQIVRDYVDSILQGIRTEQAAQSAEEDSDNHVEARGS